MQLAFEDLNNITMKMKMHGIKCTIQENLMGIASNKSYVILSLNHHQHLHKHVLFLNFIVEKCWFICDFILKIIISLFWTQNRKFQQRPI